MIHLGTVLLNHLPRIAVTITDQETNKQLTSLGVDVLEVRADRLKEFHPDDVRKNILHRKKTGLPIILTVRNQKAEGGKGNISDKRKMEIFQSGIPIVEAVDIELSSFVLPPVVSLAKKHKKIILVSLHNFQFTPPAIDLEKKFQNARKKGADIVKMALQANSFDDVHRLLEFTLKHKDDHLITMSLGTTGKISRVLFPLAGSLLTYSYLDCPFAPGQLPAKILQEQLCLYSPSYKEYFSRKRSRRFK